MLRGLLVLCLLLSGCPRGKAPSGETDRVVISIDGSSTVYPITEAMAEEFQKQAGSRVRITVGISGTGGGFKKFCRGETWISQASRPIREEEIALCEKNGVEFVELPVAYDGIAVVVHPENTWVSYLTVSQLRRLWAPDAQGKVTRWRQLDPRWPDEEIQLFGPGVDSGTFDYFTLAILGQSGASRGDYTASEDDNVLVQGVARDPYALGYFGFAYYWENREVLRAVPIDDENPENGDGPIPPTPETIRNGTYQPLSRPLFLYVRADRLREEAALRAFVEFFLKQSPALVPQVGYVPFSEEAYAQLLRFLNMPQKGPFFSRQLEPGMALEEFLRILEG